MRAWVLQRFPFAGYTSRRAFPKKYKQMTTNNGLYVSQSDSWIGALLHCPYCIGFWVSLGVVVGWVVAPTATLWGCLVMGLRWVTGFAVNRSD